MRLIDADKMIKDLTERYEDNLGRDVILKLIGEQPEAYNAEKVVEELERQEEIVRELKYDRFFSGQERAYIKAREIVKAGGQYE